MHLLIMQRFPSFPEKVVYGGWGLTVCLRVSPTSVRITFTLVSSRIASKRGKGRGMGATSPDTVECGTPVYLPPRQNFG